MRTVSADIDLALTGCDLSAGSARVEAPALAHVISAVHHLVRARAAGYLPEDLEAHYTARGESSAEAIAQLLGHGVQLSQLVDEILTFYTATGPPSAVPCPDTPS